MRKKLGGAGGARGVIWWAVKGPPTPTMAFEPFGGWLVRHTPGAKFFPPRPAGGAACREGGPAGWGGPLMKEGPIGVICQLGSAAGSRPPRRRHRPRFARLPTPGYKPQARR